MVPYHPHPHPAVGIIQKQYTVGESGVGCNTINCFNSQQVVTLALQHPLAACNRTAALSQL